MLQENQPTRTGETEMVYSKQVAQLAHELVTALKASENEELRSAIMGIVRLAETTDDHRLTEGVIRGKLEAFKIDEGTIVSLLHSLQNMTTLVWFFPPCQTDSKYLYQFRLRFKLDGSY